MNLRSQVGPVVLVIAGLALLLALGVAGWFSFHQASSTGEQIVVKVANPNDPKFRPDPRLGGGGR